MDSRNQKAKKPLTPEQKERQKERQKQRRELLLAQHIRTEQLNADHPAFKFYNTFNDLNNKNIVIESELAAYAKELYSFQKYGDPVISISPPLPKPTPTALNENNVLITFSGGTDCVASAIWALNKNYTVYLLHILDLNHSVSAYENDASHAVAATLGLKENLIIIRHNRKICEENKNGLLENPAKNQYIYYIALDYMKKFNCKKLIASGQLDDCAYFSDTIRSYELFYPFAESIIGEHECIFPFRKKNSYVFTLLQASRTPGREGLLFQVNSCFHRRFAGVDTGCFLARFENKPDKSFLATLKIPNKAAFIKAAYIRVNDQCFYFDKSLKIYKDLAFTPEQLAQFDNLVDTHTKTIGELTMLSYQQRIAIYTLTGHLSNTNECGKCQKCKEISGIRQTFATSFQAPEDMPVIIRGHSAPSSSLAIRQTPLPSTQGFTFFSQAQPAITKRKLEAMQEVDMSENKERPNKKPKGDNPQ